MSALHVPRLLIVVAERFKRSVRKARQSKLLSAFSCSCFQIIHVTTIAAMLVGENAGAMHHVTQFDLKGRREYHRCILNGAELIAARKFSRVRLTGQSWSGYSFVSIAYDKRFI